MKRLPTWLRWPRPNVRIHAEQALYGSFPFRHRGYELLTRSPGCTPETLGAFARACAAYGDRPGGASARGGLFALRAPGRGLWMIVGVGEAGTDDRGRPGALAFHGLFLTHRDYRRLGAAPFALAHHHRTQWTSDPGSLPSLSFRVERFAPRPDEPSPKALAIAHALRRGRRVALEAAGPIDDLARVVWAVLPLRVRLKTQLATWAFGNANRFDFLAVPRLVLLEPDPSCVDPDQLEIPPPPRRRWRDRLPRRPQPPVQSRPS